MGGFFSLDSKFMQAMSRVADLIILNVIYLVTYLPRTVLIVVINVLPWALLLTNLYLFLQVGFIWVAVYFAAAAYINTRLLKKVFAPYMEPEEEAQ